MINHVEIQELIPAFVINALEPDEMRRVEAHLRTCVECHGIADEYRRVPAALALSAPQFAPPTELRARTLRRAQSDSLPQHFRGEHVRESRFRFSPWLAAAALVVALLGLGLGVWQDRELYRELIAQRDLLTVIAYAEGPTQDVPATAADSRATGKLYLDPDSAVAALIAVNMPLLDNAHEYHLWLRQLDGNLVGAGRFRVDGEGNGWLLIRAPKHLADYNEVSVSVESNGTSDQRSGQIILQTAFRVQ